MYTCIHTHECNFLFLLEGSPETPITQDHNSGRSKSEHCEAVADGLYDVYYYEGKY